MTRGNSRRHDYHHQDRASRVLSDHEQLAELFPAIMELAKHDGNHAVFVIERPEDDTDETRSFSAEAMNAMHVEILTFVVSRVMREWDRTSHAPKRVAVSVHVKVG